MTILMNCLLLGICMWFSFTDLKSRRIPNKLTHPIVFLLLIIRVFNPMYYWGLVPALLMLIFFFIRPNAIGAGDIKMTAIIGLCLGIERMLFVMLGMCISALISLFVYEWLNKRKLRSIPLAPFLTIGVFLAVAL